MPQKIYFGTNAFREIGQGLLDVGLPDDLRERVVISPLSAFEVLSQLSIAKADEVLHEIQAIHNWINPKSAGLLPWPDDALASIVSGKPTKDDDFTVRMQTALNVCLNSTSAGPLREEAGKLKDVMDAMKLKTADDFARLLDAARKESPTGDWFSAAWSRGVAKRAGADPDSKSEAELVNALSAYHEFEQAKLLTALNSKDYNPRTRQHQNDLLDAEQLIYLGSPELYFLTCDAGFARVKDSPQAARIIIVGPEELAAPNQIEAVLRQYTN